MKYVKMLGLLAVAAAALMAFAGTASASTLTSPSGTNMAVGATLEATSINTELHGPFSSVSCAHSEVKGEIKQNGTQNGSKTDAGGNITTLDFDECSSNVTDASSLGTLEINKKGEVFSSGTVIAIHTSVGECVFSTNNTKIGTLTGGTGATLDIAGNIPRTGGSFFCGSSGEWTGNYSVTSPSYLAVH
jgi:hypothetical protein